MGKQVFWSITFLRRRGRWMAFQKSTERPAGGEWSSASRSKKWWRDTRGSIGRSLNARDERQPREVAILSRTKRWSRKPNLPAAVGRIPVQRMFKLSRNRWSFELAGQNFTIG